MTATPLAFLSLDRRRRNISGAAPPGKTPVAASRRADARRTALPAPAAQDQVPPPAAAATLRAAPAFPPDPSPDNRRSPVRRRKQGLAVLLCLGLLALVLAVPSLAEGATKNLCRIGKDVVIEEEETVRHIVVVGGQVTIHGTVEGNVAAIGGSVVLTNTAVVEGDVLSLGGVIVIGRGADVQGNLTEINAASLSAALSSVMNGEWEGWSWVFAIVSLTVFAGILALALLLLAFAAGPVRVMSRAIRTRALGVALWGVAALVLVVPLAALLAISVVGIVLIPLEVSLFVLASLVGFVSVARFLGRAFYDLRKKPEERIVRETLWGLVILWLVGWIPYLGLTVKVLAVVLGLGSVIVTGFGFRKTP